MASQQSNGGLVFKLILTALGPLLAAVLMFGILEANVARNEKDIDNVDQRRATDHIELLQEMRRMDAKIDRLLERSP